jgi:hypothetical protein
MVYFLLAGLQQFLSSSDHSSCLRQERSGIRLVMLADPAHPST